jgi:hypothetical protein
MISIQLPKPLGTYPFLNWEILKDSITVVKGFDDPEVYTINTSGVQHFKVQEDIEELHVNIRNDEFTFWCVRGSMGFTEQHGKFVDEKWIPTYKKRTKQDYKIKNSPGREHKFPWCMFTNNIKDEFYDWQDAMFSLKTFMPKDMPKIITNVKVKEVCLYNVQTTNCKVFKLDGRPLVTDICDNVAVAITSRTAYFFDLD